MLQYAIIETEDGLAVTQLRSTKPLDDLAAEHGAIVVDPGPYGSFDEAYDAMIAIEEEEGEDEGA